MTSQGYEVLARMQTGKPGPSGGSGNGNGASLGHDDVSLSDIAIGVVIGRTSEFFDFFVYAIASVLVFPKLVFTWLPPLEGTLASFAVFSLAFLARPVGSICFSTLDRTFGRGVQADGCARVARRVDRRCRLAARVRHGRLCIGRIACAVPARPGFCPRGHVGRPADAAGAERSRKPARLVRDDPATGRTPRADRCQPAVCVLYVVAQFG